MADAAVLQFTPRQVADAIRRARGLLTPANRRCLQLGAVDAAGEEVSPVDPAAVKWSACGALEKVTATDDRDGLLFQQAYDALEAAATAAGHETFIVADDSADTAALLGIFDAAAKAIEPEPELPLRNGQTTTARVVPTGPAAAARRATQPATAATPARETEVVHHPGATRSGAEQTPATRPQAGGDVYSNVSDLPEEVKGKGLYTSLPELLAAMDKLRANFNVSSPVVRPDLIPPLHAVALRMVAIDTRPNSPDLWAGRVLKSGERAFTRIGLQKIASAMGMNMFTDRVDDRTHPYIRTYRACGQYKSFDGQTVSVERHRTYDLTDGGKDTPGMSVKELDQARRFIDELCESKALNRVIRAVALLKSSYPADELARPFVVFAVVFTGHSDDPEVRKMVAEIITKNAIGATQRLFGGDRPRPALAHDRPAPTDAEGRDPADEDPYAGR